MLTKQECIRIVTQCAKLYKANLLDKKLLIVYSESKDTTNSMEILFSVENFLHLTGLTTKNIPAKRFFELALSSKVPLGSISLKSDGTTEMKLSILQDSMNIHKIARMVGEYNQIKTALVTEKLAGTTFLCLGFVEKGGVYIPNTVLCEDIRNVTFKPQCRILAMYIKDKDSIKYAERTYLAANIDENLFPAIIKNQING